MASIASAAGAPADRGSSGVAGLPYHGEDFRCVAGAVADAGDEELGDGRVRGPLTEGTQDVQVRDVFGPSSERRSQGK